VIENHRSVLIKLLVFIVPALTLHIGSSVCMLG
jgi:hypothetical protein